MSKVKLYRDKGISLQKVADSVDAAANDAFMEWKSEAAISHFIVNKHGKYTLFFGEVGDDNAEFINVRCPLNLAELNDPITFERISSANEEENWVIDGEIVVLGPINFNF